MSINKLHKEGPLKKWTNYMKGWKDRYFILDQGVLSYCKSRGDRLKGMIHMGVAKIIKHKKSRRKIVLDSGVSILHLKAASPEDRDQWFSALENSQAEVKNAQEPLPTLKEDVPDTCPELKPLDDKLSELWELDCNLEEAIDVLPEHIRKRHEAFGKLANIAKNIKTSLTEVLGFLENQQMQILRLKERKKSEMSSSDEESSPTHEEKKEQPLLDLGEPEAQVLDEDIFFDALDDQPVVESPSKSSQPHRQCLPVPRNPEQKFNIWKVIKDSIGKDLSKMSVPVYFNEPLSFLQRFTEDLTFSHLLVQADEAQDPALRVAFVGCFAVSGYASTSGRTMKPFNPVLGETFELEQDGFRIVSEQVSHHPPISAIHVDHPHYWFSGNTEMKSSFKGTYLQLHPAGTLHVYLKSWDEHYTYIKPLTSVHNLIIGKVYVDHHGRIEVTCEKTQAKAVLNLKKQGWFEKHLHYVEGSALDASGNLKYILEGTWSGGMTIREAEGTNTLGEWKPLPDYEGKDRNYFFTSFTLQLNIPPTLYPTPIPRTDSRWRPDQRALENGDTKLAKSEKERVEEKQRKARKDKEQQGVEYQPRWFSLVDEEYRYIGGYWEAKEHPETMAVPDIF